MRDKNIDGLKHQLRGRVFDEDMIVDIKDFDIVNSKESFFVSEYQDRTFCIDDFNYLIIPGKTFKSIVDDIYQKAFEAGRRSKNKRQEIEVPPVDIEEKIE